MKCEKLLAIIIPLVLWGTIVCAQAPPDANQYVSRQEYEKLKQEMETLRAEMAAIRKERVAPAMDIGQKREMEVLKTEVETLKKERTLQTEDVNELSAQIQAVKNEAEITRQGTTKFLLTGYGFVGFTDKHGENSVFSTGFNPILLWQMNDRLLFEGELELEPTSEGTAETSETETMLEYANISYLLNDYMTVGGGKFLLPVGIFNQRLHPKWINKLPDRPLPYDDEVGIIPEAGIGAFVRGAVPAGSMKFNYDLYVDNGPALITDNPDTAGMMDFDNFTDNNNNKAVGGRIGFLPIPELEVGYSIQSAKVSSSDFADVDTLISAVDASYLKQIEAIRGTIDVRGEFVWSDVDKATYDPTGALEFGPLRFDNDRHAYYVQAAYRPTLADEKILRNFEFILRYDAINAPSGAPGSVDEHRWTPGIDYWVTPSMVLKLAYQFDNKSGEQDQDALMLQAALGF